MESIAKLEDSTSGATSGDEDWQSFSEASWCEAESAAEEDVMDSMYETMEGAMSEGEKGERGRCYCLVLKGRFISESEEWYPGFLVLV